MCVCGCVGAGNNLTGFASHFAKQFLLDAKELQNIVAENCDAVCRHVAQCKCYAKRVHLWYKRIPIRKLVPRRISHTHVTPRS